MKLLKSNAWFRQTSHEPSTLWTGDLYIGTYQKGGATYLNLVDKNEHESIAMCTVNLPEVPLGPGEIILKSYSENTGMLESFIEQGIVSAPLRYVQTGHVQVPIVQLLIPKP